MAQSVSLERKNEASSSTISVARVLPSASLSKLVVTKPPDMRFLMQPMPKSGKPILVPSQRISHGLVPNAPHFALAVAVLRHFRLRRGLPAASQPVNEVTVGEIGQTGSSSALQDCIAETPASFRDCAAVAAALGSN